MKQLVLVCAVACTAALLACRSDRADQAPVRSSSKPELQLADSGEPLGLEHYHVWSQKLSQGGEPVGEQAFRNLAALGVTTVLSVDGAATNVELAAKYGLQYRHVPIGYDGITRGQALEIAKVVQGSDGPVYVHCHHGLHRGPAAAAVARIVVDGVSNEQALEDLEKSGCSPKYAGLYRDVGQFRAPSAADLAAAELPSALSAPQGIIQSMSYIDRRWDLVTAGKAAHWGKLPKHPDVDLAHEVGMIENTLRSLVADDGLTAEYDAHFAALLIESHSAAIELEQAIRAQRVDAADAAHGRLEASCDACHAEYRNSN